MRTAVRLSFALVASLSASALAQTEPSPLYRNTVEHFAAIFPSPPKSRDVTYVMKDGMKRPARQFYVDQGNDHYTLTLVKVPEARGGIDKDVIDYAADQVRKKGMVRFNFHNCYDPGVPGQQLNLAEGSGNQLRASVYMWDHQLYITEASAMPGSQAALQFEQSITILAANGEDLNTGQGSPPC
jgi:hypothetical protein